MYTEFIIIEAEAWREGGLIALRLISETGTEALLTMDISEALSLARYLVDCRYMYENDTEILMSLIAFFEVKDARVFPSDQPGWCAVIRDPRGSIEVYVIAKHPRDVARVIWKAVRGAADTHSTDP